MLPRQARAPIEGRGNGRLIGSGNGTVIPTVLLAIINTYSLWNQHWEHWAHLPPLEENPQYPYQNIRTKNYILGNGDKVSLPFKTWLISR